MLTEALLPPPHMSWWQVASQLPEAQRDRILSTLQEDELSLMLGDWFIHARREQIPPIGKWFIWMIMAGRGFGKNYSGSNWLIDQHLNEGAMNSAIVAATSSDLRKYCLEGPSGILQLAPKHFYPRYIPSKTKLIWPNGGETHLYTSEKPNRLRGANHDRAWCDELSYWNYAEAVWDMLMLTLRYGNDVRCMITMTPRPIKVVRDLLDREGDDVVVTRGSTRDNKDNLSPTFMKTILDQYAGTRLGRQEIDGEFLSDVDGALWDHEMLDRTRRSEAPTLVETVVALDPATTSGEKSDETGIIVVGKDKNKHGYILADKTMKGSPNSWGQSAVSLYRFHKANRIVAEKNQGGDMISEIIHNIDPTVPVKLVHASKGKEARAEPIGALYEQEKVHHIGTYSKLEDEMCMFVPGDIIGSPNRVDAMVWGVHELLIAPKLRAGTWGRGNKAA